MSLFKLPPPLNTTDINSPGWRDWFYKLQKYVGTIGAIGWEAINLPEAVKNTFLAGPVTGDDAKVAFREIETADLGAGTANITKYLRGDKSWAVPAASEVKVTPTGEISADDVQEALTELDTKKIPTTALPDIYAFAAAQG